MYKWIGLKNREYLGPVWPADVWPANDIPFCSIFTYFQYSLIHDLALSTSYQCQCLKQVSKSVVLIISFNKSGCFNWFWGKIFCYSVKMKGEFLEIIITQPLLTLLNSHIQKIKKTSIANLGNNMSFWVFPGHTYTL